MNRIQVILSIDIENLPENFQEILVHEQEVISKWKEMGIIEHLFLRKNKDGAIIIFKDVEENEAVELMQSLPLYKLKKSIEYYNLIKQF
jgi:hypothetical protein